MESVEPAHSPLGPSSSKRWINCPASVALTDGIPDKDTVYNTQGRAAHHISELCRDNNRTASEYLGYAEGPEMLDHEGQPIICDQEMVDAVQVFLDHVNQFEGDTFCEEGVHYDRYVPGGFGTADDIRVSIDGRICWITDLKYGKGVQEYAPKNSQLMLYAIGFLEEYGWLYPDIEEFVLTICQPRLDHIDEWDITVGELVHWAKSVAAPAARRTEYDEAPLQPGSWCQFCLIRDRCRGRANWVLQQLDRATEEQGATVIDNRELALLLPHLPTIRGWCNDMDALALSEVQKGTPVGEYKLVEGRSNRTWRDEAKAVGGFKKYKFKVADTIKKKIISPKEFETLAGKKHPLMTLRGSNGQLLYVVKPQGRPVLVPGEDPRKTYQVNAESEFEGMETESLGFLDE